MKENTFQRYEKLLKERIDLLNDLARIVYQNLGYKVMKRFDFHNSKHPMEQTCFAIAVRIFNHLQDKGLII